MPPNHLAGLPAPILFLKATTKKQLWIPQFTKKNGQVVGGHYAHVHVSDDHLDHKVATGQGTYSQKKAHAKLTAEEPGYFAMNAEEQAALVMHHATLIQDEESMAARLATLKKKLLGGSAPTPGEWKMFHAAPPEKKHKITTDVHAAGHGALMDSLYATFVGSQPPAPAAEAAQPQNEQQNIPKNIPAEQELAKPAEKAPEPEAAPAEEKPATAAPEPKLANPGKLTIPEFAEGKETTGVKAHYEKMAQKIIDHAAAGNVAVLEDMPNPEKGNSWKGKTANSKALMALHAQALAHAKGEKPAAAVAMTVDQLKAKLGVAIDATEAKKICDAYIAEHGTEKAKNAAISIAGAIGFTGVANELAGPQEGDTKQGANGGTLVLKDGHWLLAPGAVAKAATSAANDTATPADDVEQKALATAFEHSKVDASNTNAGSFNPKVDAIIAAFNAGDTKALLAMNFGTNTYGKKAAKMANEALAFLESRHTVAPGQKAGTHAALAPKAKPEPAAAPAAPSVPQAPSIVGMSVTATDAIIEAETAFNAGNVDKLEILLASVTGLNSFAPIEKYLNEAIAHLKAQGATADTPAKSSIPPQFADNFPVKNFIWTLKSAHKQQADYPPSEWVDAEDLAGYAALWPADKAVVDAAIAAISPQAAQSLAEWKEWHAYSQKAKQGLLADEIPTIPGSKADFTDEEIGLMQQAEQAAIAGDLAAVNAVMHELDYKGTGPANGFAIAVHAKVLEKAGAPAGGHVKQADEPGLSAGEIAAVPKVAGVGEAYAQQAHDYAAAGNLSALEGYLQLHMTGGPSAESAYIELLTTALKAKKAATAAGPAAGITTADLPPTPAYASDANAKLAQQAEQLALGGDVGAFYGFYDKTLAEKGHIGKLAKHFKAIKAVVDAKHSGVAAPAPAPQPEGPQEGDTKQGANGGTLVLKDGRWHKVATDPKVLKKLAASVAIPKLSGKHAINMSKIMKALKGIAETEGGAGLQKYISITAMGNVKILKQGPILHSYVPLSPHGTHGANAAALATYAKELLGAMGNTNGSNLPGGTPAAPAPKATTTMGSHTSAAPAAPAAPLAKTTVKVGELTAMLADGWVQTGEQKGSNPGGKFKDAKGVEWYCKFPNDPETVKNELLAAKFYEMLGSPVPHLRLVMKDGKLGIASKWVDGIKKGTAEQLAKADGAHSGFVFDAWLANWDVVGLANDNLMLGKDGKALRVDVGGSLVYRAQGGLKGAAFGDTVTELDTLIDVSKNSQSAAVFAGIKHEDLIAGANTLAKMRDGQIKKLVAMFGPGDDAAKEILTEKLKARRAYILAKLEVADPWVKVKPDLTKLVVDPDDLSKPIDFFNHPSKGGPLSSKDLINKQNTIDDAALFEFAKQGNLQALKDYHYDAYDKETGAYIGKKPITDHPAKDIKEHWAQAIDVLQTIAFPSVQGLAMPPMHTGGSLEETAAAAGAFAFGHTIETIPAEKRLGFWMKLAQAGDDFMDLVPKKTHWFSSALATKSKASFKSLSKITRSYIQQVQASGWINHIYSKGDKKVTLNDPDMGGTLYDGPLAPMVSDLYKNAHDLEEGLKLTRWMAMDHKMIAQLLTEKPGLIFQNSNSMCTSFEEGWGKSSKFGSDCVMNIVCAKGAKGLHSFASGSFGKEYEITTMPGARFVLLKATKGNVSSTSGITIDVLMLPTDENWMAGVQGAVK